LRREEVEDTFDGGGQDSVEEEEEEEEHEEGEGHYEGEARHYEDEVGGDGSASRFASSRRYRTSHLVRPPVAPHKDNRVAIIPSGDA
jgi:hypothetical protein